MNALFQSLTGLTLRDPAFLWVTLAVPLVVWSGRTEVRPYGLTFGASGLLPDVGSWRTALLPFPSALCALGTLACVIALARPGNVVADPVRAEGIDLLLCLDVSSSMSSADMAGGRSRLAVAKDAAERFIAGRADDRIGLIGFARYPDLRCPPTRDHAALVEILRDLPTVPSDGPEDATGIGTAVARAADVLRGSGAKSKVVVCLTDGEENVATRTSAAEIAPVHAAQLAEQMGVRVHVVVLGTGRPAPGGGWVKPDVRQVQRLAQRTGGLLLEAADATALAQVYDRIDLLERSPVEEPRSTWVDEFLPFLVAGILLVLLGRLVGATILRVSP